MSEESKRKRVQLVAGLSTTQWVELAYFNQWLTVEAMRNGVQAMPLAKLREQVARLKPKDFSKPDVEAANAAFFLTPRGGAQ